MKQGLLDFVGSDGHRQNERIPEIGRCVEKVEKTMGTEYAKKYLSKIPVRSQGDREKYLSQKRRICDILSQESFYTYYNIEEISHPQNEAYDFRVL